MRILVMIFDAVICNLMIVYAGVANFIYIMIAFYLAIEGKNNIESFPSYTIKLVVVNCEGTAGGFSVKNIAINFVVSSQLF